jgi:hypothetical protein
MGQSRQVNVIVSIRLLCGLSQRQMRIKTAALAR